MLDKLAQIERRFAEIEAQVADPEIYGDQGRFAKLMRERADIEEIVTVYRKRVETDGRLEEARALRGTYARAEPAGSLLADSAVDPRGA